MKENADRYTQNRFFLFFFFLFVGAGEKTKHTFNCTSSNRGPTIRFPHTYSSGIIVSR